MSALLSACGIQGSANTTRDNIDWPAFWRKQRPTKELQFANWPLYIDQDKGHSESLALFEKATGIRVTYHAVIQDNATFYATQSPILRAKGSTGYDIVVMTNGWELTEMIDNGFVMQLDHSQLPNFAKYASPGVKNPNYDPGNAHSVVWQSGLTGLAVNTKYIKRDITSFKDLMDPAFRGHVGMMGDLTELGSAALMATGVDPSKSKPADWRRARDWLKKLAPSVSGYYDQSYINHIQNGDTWITQAWSGDVFQAQVSGYPHIKFITPDEGFMMWHDNMLIPMQAANPVSALKWMNFYYQPKIAGIVEDYVNYICPVPAAEDYIRHQLDDPDVANSPLIFPTNEVLSRARSFYVFHNYDEYSTWNSIFNSVVQS